MFNLSKKIVEKSKVGIIEKRTAGEIENFLTKAVIFLYAEGRSDELFAVKTAEEVSFATFELVTMVKLGALKKGGGRGGFGKVGEGFGGELADD